MTKKVMPRTFDDMISSHPKKTQAMALKLRNLVQNSLVDTEEQIVGGAKVGLALYTDSETNKVLCGVQPTDGACLLYVHHIKNFKHPRMKLEGRGKHAKHIRFQSMDDVREEDVRWVLSEVEKLLPQG